MSDAATPAERPSTGVEAVQAVRRRLSAPETGRLAVDRPEALAELQRLIDGLEEGSEVAVFSVDLDEFSVIDDLLGPDDREALVCSVGRRLRAAVHPTASVLRMREAEYMISVTTEAADRSAVQAVAAAIRGAGESSADATGSEPPVVMRTGATRAGRGSRASEALREASIARYQVGSQAWDSYAMFSPEFRDGLLFRQRVHLALRSALGADRSVLGVDFQPIVDLRSRRIIGFEALARWRGSIGDPLLREALTPDEFIPVAEQCGLIGPLDRHLLTTAVRSFADCPWTEGLCLWINVSRYSLLDEDFLTYLSSTVAIAGLDPSMLCVELTETALAIDDVRLVEVIVRLREAGFEVALDDFGTGVSSLGAIAGLALSVVKTAKTFVEGIGRRSGAEAVLAGIAVIAQAREMGLVIEGIETDEQAGAALDSGCRYGQGYLFGRPGALASFADRINAQPPPTP